MRKISVLALLFAFVFVISSCSSDSSSSGGNSGGPQISSINEKIYSSGILDSDRSYLFSYENNILKNIVIGTTRIDFTFTGDKIMTTKTYVSSVLQNTGNFTYVGDALMSYTNVSATSLPQQKKEYDYAAGKLQQIRSYFYSADNWVYNFGYDYSFDNLFNATQMIETNHYGSSDFDYKESYEYDNLNNPFKNMNPYLRLVMMRDFKNINIMSNNNIVKGYYYATPGSTTPAWSYNYVIVYNSDNYPVSIKKYKVVNGVNTDLVSEMTLVYTP